MSYKEKNILCLLYATDTRRAVYFLDKWANGMVGIKPKKDGLFRHMIKSKAARTPFKSIVFPLKVL